MMEHAATPTELDAEVCCVLHHLLGRCLREHLVEQDNARLLCTERSQGDLGGLILGHGGTLPVSGKVCQAPSTCARTTAGSKR